jgi:hypothetical protein
MRLSSMASRIWRRCKRSSLLSFGFTTSTAARGSAAALEQHQQTAAHSDKQRQLMAANNEKSCTEIAIDIVSAL